MFKFLMSIFTAFHLLPPMIADRTYHPWYVLSGGEWYCPNAMHPPAARQPEGACWYISCSEDLLLSQVLSAVGVVFEDLVHIK